MPVLLLCYGDPQAKDLLRKAIEARYGPTPPAIESLTIRFKGRARRKLGPVKAWVPTDSETYFLFPSHIRWDFVVKPMGLPVQKGVEAYDGGVFHSVRGGGSPSVIKDEDVKISMRRRLWAISALFLTPLSDPSVKLTAIDGQSFQAENAKLDDAVTTLVLRDDKRLDYVQVRGINPESDKEQTLKMQLSETQKPVNGLMMPETISAYWDDELSFELEPIDADLNPPLEREVFTLEWLD